jgi:hypothetical protein
MGATDVRRACGTALLALCTLLAACGEPDSEEKKQDIPWQVKTEPPTRTPTPPLPAEPDSHAAEEAANQARARAIDRSLRGLESDDLAARRAAVQALLAQDFDLADILRLAFRATRWQRDQGLLADLLSDFPQAVLPLLLDRIGHSAPVHRARLCAALGHPRETLHPAFAVVLLRAFYDEFDGVRAAARDALRQLSARGSEIIRLHEASAECSDAAGAWDLLPAVILGPFPDDAYVNVLIDVLVHELRRFPGPDSYAIACLLAELAGDPSALDRILTVLEEEEFYGDVLVQVLEGAGLEALPALRSHLERGVHIAETLQAVATLGTEAVELGDLLAPLLLQPEYGGAAVLTLWHTQANSDAAQAALYQLWWRVHKRPDTEAETAAHASTLLCLLRPRREVVDLIIEQLGGEKLALPAQASLLRILGWCAQEERPRVRPVIQDLLATRPKRAARLRSQASLHLLDASEAEMLALVKKALAESP